MYQPGVEERTCFSGTAKRWEGPVQIESGGSNDTLRQMTKPCRTHHQELYSASDSFHTE